MTDAIDLKTDGNINDVVDLKTSGNIIPIPDAELTATVSTLAVKRLGGLSPEDAKQKYGLYYNLALQNQEEQIRSELINLKLNRMKDMGTLAIKEASEIGDTETIKDITEFNYAYDLDKDKFIITEVEAAKEIYESAVEDKDREIQINKDINKSITSPSLSYSDAVTDIVTEKMMLNKLITKYRNRLGVSTVGEILSLMLPLYTMNSFSQKIKTDDKHNDFFQGNDIREQINKFRSMSTEEKATVLKNLDDFFDGKTGFDFTRYPIKDLEEMSQGQGNNLLALTYFSYLMDFAGWEQGLENVAHGLDMFVLAAPAAKVLKAGTTLANVGRKVASAIVANKVISAGVIVGNRSSAVAQATSIHTAVRTGDVAKDSAVAVEAAELTVSKSIDPLSNGNTVGISGRVLSELDTQQKLADELINTSQVKYLDEIDAEKLKNSLSPAVKEVTLVTKDSSTGLNSIDIIRVIDDKAKLTENIEGINYTIVFGNKDGKGFASLEVAEDFAKQMKIEGGIVSTVEEQGTHFIQVTRPVDEVTGFITPYEGIENVSGFGAVIRSPTNYIDTSSRLAAHQTQGLKENVVNIGNKLLKSLTKLSKKEKLGLGQTLEYGRQVEGWFDLNTLKYKFNLNDNQIIAYNAVKLMDDINWKTLNSSVYSRKQRQGYKTIEIDKTKAEALDIKPNFDAKPVDTIDKAVNKTIYNVTTGKYLDSSDAQELVTLKSKGWVFASLEGTQNTTKLSAVQYIIGSPQDLKIKSLSLDQVPYLAGGRRVYTGTHFVKQGNIRYTAANVPLLLRNITHGVGTKTEAMEWASRMEAGRKIALESLEKAPSIKAQEELAEAEILASNVKFDKLKESLGITPTGSSTAKVKITSGANEIINYDEAIQKATGGLYESVEDYIKYVGDKNLLMPFEVVTDGQELSSVLKASKGMNIIKHKNDLSEANTIQRMLNYSRFGDSRSKRGPIKMGFDGNPAPMVRPMDTAINSLSRALDIVTMDKWRARHIDKFYETFGGVLAETSQRSPAAHFLDPIFIKDPTDADKLLIKKAKAMQNHYKSVLNTPTWGDEFIKDLFISPLADVFNSVTTKIGLPARYETIENLRNANPVGFVRKMAYHAYLGLFNPTQPAVQLQSTLLMMAANPVNGTKAAWLTGPMRLMLMSENPETLGALAKAAGKVIGLKGTEVKELYDILQKTGSWRLKGGTLVEQESKTLSSQGIIQKTLDIGILPFLESERFNKIAATMSAAMDWKVANPGVKVTDEGINTIRSQAELYIANMNQVDRASWQRGIAAAPTQFWGYQARALEMMLPEMVGGSRHFTWGQKLRMATAQLGLYGIGGALSPRYGLRIRETLNGMYKERYDEDLPTIAGVNVADTLESGIIESLLASALDTDVAFSQRAGLNITESGWGRIFTTLAFDQKNIDEIMKFDAVGLGVLKNVAVSVYDFVSLINPKAIEFASAEHARLLWAGFQHGLKQNISSYNIYDRAAWAIETGKWMDKTGNVTDRNVTNIEIALGVMGLDPADTTTKRAMQQALAANKRDYKFEVDLLTTHLNYAINSKGKDKWDSYKRLQLGLLGGLSEKDKLNINKRVLKKSGKNEAWLIKKYAEVFETNPLGRED
tara:strand:- start:14599 stop:19431 length:4833 start_codon:yes stop_codon:yes gene_type:complete